MKKLIDKYKLKKTYVFKEHSEQNNQHFAIKSKNLKLVGNERNPH